MYHGDGASGPQNNILVHVCSLLRQLEQEHVFIQIRRRILLIVLYRLRQKFAKREFQNFIDIIHRSRLVGDDEDATRRSLSRWVRGGKKYHILGHDLGGIGFVVLLPFDAGFTM